MFHIVSEICTTSAPPEIASRLRRFNPEVPAHVKAAKAEEQLARDVHKIKDEAVIRWGDPIGAHGADVISVNLKTAVVTLWDSKYRTAITNLAHSKTFAFDSFGRPTPARSSAIREALDTLRIDKALPDAVRLKALKNLEAEKIRTITAAAGNGKNSVIGW
jgi:filamentous hemagglutinin